MRSALRTGLDRWNAWRTRSASRRIFAAMVTVGGFTLMARLVSMAKELLVAHRFGIGDALDAFFIAYLLPSFAVNVVAGSFSYALIPTYIEVRERDGREQAQQLFAAVSVWGTAALLVCSALVGLAFPVLLPLMASSFRPEKLALTRSLFYILLPIITLSGLGATWAAVLNAGEKFALAAVTPIITPTVTILLLIAAGRIWGVYALAYGIVTGALLEATLLGIGLRRHGISLRPRRGRLDAAGRQVMRQYAPMAAGAVMMTGATLVDQSMAAMLGSGSVSALNYGNKIVTLAMGIAGLALGTAVMPYFSNMVARQDWTGLRHTLHLYLRLIFLITVPLTALCWLFSAPMIRLLFQRGSFTAQNTALVAHIQDYYALQMPFFIAGLLVVRLISALKANSLLMWASALNVIVNALLDYSFMKVLGVAGIALSTAVVYLLSFTFCWIALHRKCLPAATLTQAACES